MYSPRAQLLCRSLLRRQVLESCEPCIDALCTFRLRYCSREMAGHVECLRHQAARVLDWTQPGPLRHMQLVHAHSGLTAQSNLH